MEATPTDSAPTVMILLSSSDVRRVGMELRLGGGGYLSAARNLAAASAATTAARRRSTG